MGGTSGPVETLADTHGLVTRPGTRIWASSEGRGWRSVFATSQHETPFEAECSAVPDHLIVVHLSGPVHVTRMLGGKRETCLVAPGGSFIMPGEVEFGVRLEAALDTVHFYLHRVVFEELAEEFAVGAGSTRVIPRLGKPDPLLEQIAIGLRDELQDGTPASALYVDQLARVAAARLIRAHSTAVLKSAADRPSAGLAQRRFQRVRDYIASHLDSDPTLSELAAVAGLSPVYFARAFRATTGLAPHQYLLRARVERAKRLLMTSDLRIAAIALECGFCHQEHLTRVFRKHCGMTPGVYRAAVRS